MRIIPYCEAAMKKVFVTGATGLIGSEALLPLIDAGFDVYALTSGPPRPGCGGVHWISGSFFDHSFLEKEFANLRPEGLMHFAWTTARDYLSSEANGELLQASMEMLRLFTQYGGQSAIFAGTSFEYEFKDSPLSEIDPLAPRTPYARCKNELRQRAQEFADVHRVALCWGRIFYVFGRNEHEWRFVPDIVRSLAAGKTTIVRNGSLIRDYMYAKDVAAAMVRCLAEKITGCVNICTGAGIALGDLAGIFARAMNREDILVVNDEPTEQPKIIVGDAGRLRNEVGFSPNYSIERAAIEIIKTFM